MNTTRSPARSRAGGDTRRKPFTVEMVGRNTAEARVGARVVGRAHAWLDCRGVFVILSSGVSKSYRRRGIASAMYRAIEESSGQRLSPAISLSDDAFEFWKRYRPEAVSKDLRHWLDQLIGARVIEDGLPGRLIRASGGSATMEYDEPQPGGTQTIILRRDLNAALSRAGSQVIDFDNPEAARHLPSPPHAKSEPLAFSQTEPAVGKNSGFAGVNPEIRFSFAGDKAATADRFTLASAQERLAAGETPEDIRKSTGWLRGVDGKWRFEIDDSGASLKPAIKTLRTGALTDRDIASVTWRKLPDGLYDLSLNPPSPKTTADFVHLTAVDEDVVHAVLPQEVLEQIRRGEGDEDWISDFQDAKRITAGFRFEGLNALPLEHVLEHPALFAAYPALRHLMVQVDPALHIGGSYVMMMNGQHVLRTGIGQQLKTMLHEIQHGIQFIEGFATGGTIESARSIEEEWQDSQIEAAHERFLEQESRSPRTFRAYQDLQHQFQAALANHAISAFDASGRPIRLIDQGRALAKVCTPDERANRSRLQQLYNDAVEEELGGFASDPFREWSDVLQALAAARTSSARSPLDIYRRLAGEVEARNVQARRELTSTERQATPPAATADVPDSEQIVIFNRSRANREDLTDPPPIEIESHDRWSIYQERSAQVGDGYLRWVEDPDSAYVIDIQAGPSHRGRALLEWLKQTTGKSLHAVGVVDDAQGFWDRMEEDGLVDGQSDEDFMSFFGRAPATRVESVTPKDPTQTAAFLAWFGASKVVDELGQPLAVFRGDREDLTIFDRRGRREPGLFLAAESERAARYTAGRGQTSAGAPKALYAKIERPLDLRDPYEVWRRGGVEKDIIQDIHDDYQAEIDHPDTGQPHSIGDTLDALESGNLWRLDGVGGFYMDAWRALQRRAEANGFDGLILWDDGEGVGRGLDYVVFDPSQVKSATDNNGQFNPTNPDIRYSFADDGHALQAESGELKPRSSVTDTPAFKSWFADSNLVDDQTGQPMLLYHGTKWDFTTFKASKIGLTGPGAYLSPDPEVAGAYAGDGRDGKGGQHIMPVYARGKFMGLHQWSRYVQDAGGHWEAARQTATLDGFAGIWDQQYEDAVNVWEPDGNIKSAIGNNGAFDHRSSDIRFSFEEPALAPLASHSSEASAGEILVRFNGKDRPQAPTPANAMPSRQQRAANFDRWSARLPIANEGLSSYLGGPAVFVAYHGTTHTDIHAFKRWGNPEGFLGPGPYFTTSADDASLNYAGIGPDLTERLSNRAEDLNRDADDDTMTELLRSYYDAHPDIAPVTGWDDIATNEAWEEHGDSAAWYAAERHLKGASDGLVMKVFVKLENPADTTGTSADLTYIGPDDDSVEESGTLIDWILAARRVAYQHRIDVEPYVDALLGYGEPEDINMAHVLSLTLAHLREAYDDSGELLVAGALFAEIAEEAGYDGVIMDADLHFGSAQRGHGGVRPRGMPGVKRGVVHVVPFSATQVKSAIGNNGEFDGTNVDIRFSTRDHDDAQANSPAFKFVASHDGKPWIYFQVGERVDQTAYPGQHATVVEIKEERDKVTKYRVEIDVRGHPEGVDENGDAVDTKYAWFSDEALNAANASRLSGHHNSRAESIAPASGGAPRARTETAAFRRWFAGSKVVDSDGKPLVVYHGTAADFDSFDKTGANDLGLWGRGHYFSASAENASSYALRQGDGARVIPAYVSINNPLVLKTGSDLVIRLPDGTDHKELVGPNLDGSKIKQIALDGGHDGVIQIRPNGLIGDIVAFRPEQIKSATGNNGQFSPKSSDIRFSRSQVWRSALNDGVAELNYKQLPASAWTDALKSLVNKGKVKADEIEWSGVKDWLKMQGGKVGKEQVQQFLESNGVKVTETVLSEQLKPPGFRIVDSYGYTVELASNRDEALDLAAALQIQDGMPYQIEEDDQPQHASGATQYADHVLPGGSNYREILLTLAEREVPLEPLRDLQSEGWSVTVANQNQWTGQQDYEIRDQHGNRVAARYGAPISMSAQDALVDHAQHLQHQQQQEKARRTRFRSSHWSQKNVIAHIRVDDRLDVDGKRVLMVQEVQSDWGQAGRRDGFQVTDDQPLAAVQRGESGQHYWEVSTASGQFVTNVTTTDGPISEADAIAEARRRLALEPDRAAIGVPRAPFVEKTEAWVALAIKRVIQLAVDEGYDKVAFVNGAQSAERFSLDKKIGKVVWNERRGTLSVYAPGDDDSTGQQVISRTGVRSKELPHFIGKDLAERLVKQEAAHGFRTLSGLDQAVGSEGMLAFYDRIVPATLSKVLAKVGDTKLEKIQIGQPREARSDFSIKERATGGYVARIGAEAANFGDWNAANSWLNDRLGSQQTGFAVTDQLRQAIMNKGLPLFSQAEAPRGQATVASMRAAIRDVVGDSSQRPALGFGATLVVTSDEVEPAWQPLSGQVSLASLEHASESLARHRPFQSMLAEHRTAIRRAIHAIGNVAEAAIVKHRTDEKWLMILRDASDVGKWRVQRISPQGIGGHTTVGTKDRAIEYAISSGYITRDDGALDRLQPTRAFQRGLLATDLHDQLGRSQLTLAQVNAKLADFDRLNDQIDAVARRRAQAFYDPRMDTMVFVADRIRAGSERSVFLHEIVHKHGRSALPAQTWNAMVNGVKGWATAPAGSPERAIYDEAARRAGASSSNEAIRDEELLAYAVEAAVNRGIVPNAMAAEGSAQRWLATVVASLQTIGVKLVNNQLADLTAQEVVDLAYALAQMETPERSDAIREALGAELWEFLERLSPSARYHDSMQVTSPTDAPRTVPDLQKELASVESRYVDLRARGVRGGPLWDQVTRDAALIRGQLFDLTGDWYGKPKVKVVPPSDEALQATYDSPWDIPTEVLSWVRQHAGLITSDATDAVRWARIVDTTDDDRYEPGALTIWRAVASSVGDCPEIRPGDWVTTDRQYAQQHLDRWLNGAGQIIEMVVDGTDVLVSPTGNDEEAIYAPKEFSGPIHRDTSTPAEAVEPGDEDEEAVDRPTPPERNGRS